MYEDKSEEEVVRENIKLVYKIANKHLNKYRVEMDDLIQVGTIGLIKAHRRFEKDKGNTFTTYAYRLIEGEILHYILQDKHHFKTTMEKGVYHREEIKHLEYKTVFMGAKYSLDINFLLIDLERILTDKEYLVIKSYFFNKNTLKEIANILNCSECWIKKLKTKALDKLRRVYPLDL